jgi:hypothetical protein
MKRHTKYKKVQIPKYSLKADGSFLIQNYNLAKPFANFFPGIAGQYGIPMWVFYVNRGQCIASFGIKDKDHALLEFFPANKAWQTTPHLGFRSFLKVESDNQRIFYEPFDNGYLSKNFQLWNAMSITPFDLTLKEANITLGLDIEINYFSLPLAPFAALVRMVKIKNSAHKKKRIQFLDGLPLVIPSGIGNRFLKELGRTAEAWMKARIIQGCTAFYRLDVDPRDRPEIIHIQEGNFYISFTKPIIDAQSIFGPRLNLDYPYYFLKDKNFKYPKEQTGESKTPCAMGLAEFELKPDEEKCLSCLFGSIRSIELLKSRLPKIRNENYLEIKKEQNKGIIRQLQNDITTQSSSPEFNFYCRQTYLDNIIRGGYPTVFASKDGQKQVFYLYLRKHGDLERDYNRFQIQSTYFSQGNGDFRDIVQNRRNDLWFNPDIKETNLITFFNLIQTDGFNPLIIKGLRFHLKNKEDFRKVCLDSLNPRDIDKVLAFLDKPFTPGSIISFIEENNILLRVNREKFLDALIINAVKEEDAQHKQGNGEHGSGFWTDHWTYCLDLLEAYLELYPEKSSEILLEKNEFRFYDSIYVVQPRKAKYVPSYPNPTLPRRRGGVYEGKIRQLNSVILDIAKARMQEQRTSLAHWVRTEYGKGKIYQTTLITKLICILVNKLASLDPCGCGIEMEANKPNWYDALNGLPALFGSSICETMELKRLIIFLKENLSRTKEDYLFLFQELHNFLSSLSRLLTTNQADFNFWDKSYSLKEAYREKTLLGINGKEKKLDKHTLLDFLDQALIKVNAGINEALEPNNNLYCAYFINQVSEYEIKEGIIYPRKFKQKKLPLFLEAQVHALRIQKNKSSRRRLYKAIKESPLYDRKLKMYKVTGNLKDMPFEIGRCRAFSRGWLENESIWLHMEYKYLLELLRAGLYKEFYSEFKNILVCFQEPAQYGRSILENCSFLVSSVFPDKGLTGTGFVARLSGSTAEFLHIWRIINMGEKPFFLNKRGELNLRFAPVLAGWLFSKDGVYSFNLLSSIRVIYHNPKRKDTFGPSPPLRTNGKQSRTIGKNAASIKRILFKNRDGSIQEIPSDTIPCPFAERIRSRQILKIDIFF